MDHLVPHGRCHCCAFLASGRFRRSLILKASVLIGLSHSSEMTAVSQLEETTRTLHHCSVRTTSSLSRSVHKTEGTVPSFV